MLLEAWAGCKKLDLQITLQQEKEKNLQIRQYFYFCDNCLPLFQNETDCLYYYGIVKKDESMK